MKLNKLNIVVMTTIAMICSCSDDQLNIENPNN